MSSVGSENDEEELKIIKIFKVKSEVTAAAASKILLPFFVHFCAVRCSCSSHSRVQCSLNVEDGESENLNEIGDENKQHSAAVEGGEVAEMRKNYVKK